MTVKTKDYNFTIEDLELRLNVIKEASEDCIKKRLSGVEYIAFIDRQIKEVGFINRVNEARANNIQEVEFYG